MRKKSVFLCLIQLCLLCGSSNEEVVENNGANRSEAILSRRKRYLLFPEGSSLQLVCEYVWPVVGQANIWVLALSAALAWQLPSKPEHFRYWKKLKKDGEKRVDKISEKNQIMYTEMSMGNKYYFNSKKPITTYLHPPQYHQSVIPWSYNQTWYNTPWYTKNRIYPYRKIEYRKNPTQDDYDSKYNYYNHPVYTEIHRRTRRDLYPKIEQFFKAQRKDGKACLLRAICEIGRYPEEKGSFIQEIIKTIFRNKPSQTEGDLDEYDYASTQTEDCSKMYFNCTN